MPVISDKKNLILLLLFVCLVLTSCTWTDQTSPFEDSLDEVDLRSLEIIPARLIVKSDDYVNLDDMTRILGTYNNNLTKKDITSVVWQKLSGIGSVVHNEFRSYGTTGEVHIQATHVAINGTFKAEFSIIIEDNSTYPDLITSTKAPSMRLLRVTPSGSYMGANADSEAAEDEKPWHQVLLTAYYISETEVTLAAYAAFLNQTSEPVVDLIDPIGARLSWTGTDYEVNIFTENLPVTYVSYKGATAFCEWLGSGYRLPTEAEWELAARGGTNTPYPWGTSFDSTLTHVTKSNISVVASYPFNGFKLYDCLGNVREICSDWYGASYYYSGYAYNPVGPVTGTFRVLRGGSFLKKYGVRVSERDKFLPEDKLPDVGFRVVKEQNALN